LITYIPFLINFLTCRTHGISYDWVFFNPDGKQLINISNWVKESMLICFHATLVLIELEKIHLNQGVDYPFVNFMKAIEYFQQQGENETVPTKKVILNFVDPIEE
jgi:hypothetical protein